jgi:RNA polymerase sigma factor (sigma-70 family)
MASAARRCTGVEELIAREALGLRATLIRAHSSAARREDLEDLFSQAVLELLARARRDPTLSTAAHVRNAVRQKFASRVLDHQRALAGRSTAARASAQACPLELVAEKLPDRHNTVRELVQREEIRELAAAMRTLSTDQRLVLRSQIGGEPPRECCARTGWSTEKYRKLSQRARARLRVQTAPAG